MYSPAYDLHKQAYGLIIVFSLYIIFLKLYVDGCFYFFR